MSKRVAVTFRNPEKAGPYMAAVESVGLAPVLISPNETASLESLDGLLLSGGADVDPVRYGRPRLHQTDQPDVARDDLECRLLQEALARDLPVLAICRGMQLFNVAHGGTLIQHLENSAAHRVRTADPALPVHEVIVEPGSKLAGILGPGSYAVNSRHHQAIDRVGTDLKVSARSADGIIEALERPGSQFAIAVQWHPEDQTGDPAQRRLFQAFAAACEGSLLHSDLVLLVQDQAVKDG